MRRLAAALESGRVDGGLARIAAALWARVAAARLVKPLTWRAGAEVLAVGGATLGGSGKTPLCIAAARVLARDGVRVALVGHGYRARPGVARVVVSTDAVSAVGDEALACARALALALDRVPVVVGPTRQAALDLALTLADVAILDGVHQASPRASLAWLAVDSRAPWGAGACPPRGDLRAPRAALEGAADLVVPVSGTSRGIHLAGELVGWDAVRRLRVGLVTTIARPHRVEDLLAAHDVSPTLTRTFSDHSRPPHAAVVAGAPALDVWVTTAKCHPWLGETWSGGIPLGVVDYEVDLPPECRLTLTRLESYARRSSLEPRKPSHDGARQIRRSRPGHARASSG